MKVAKQYVDAGLAAQSTGDYDTAISLYEKAYQLAAHPVLIFNMAQAHRLAGHVEQARALYAKYIAEDPNGAQAKLARELLSEMEVRKAQEARKATGKPVDTSGTKLASSGVPQKRHDALNDDGQTNGTLFVTAKSQSGMEITDGTVIIDEERQGKLTRGKLTMTRVAEGHHTVAVEAEG